MYFFSDFNLHDSMENTLSHYLEWLKFQEFSGGFTPKPLQGEGLQLPQTPQLYRALPTTVQK